MYSGNPNIRTLPVSATWAHGRPAQPTRPAPPAGPTEPPRSTAPVVGSRTELARYTLPDGEQRVLYGQRVNGIVRFLPGQPGVVDVSSRDNEDSACCSRERVDDHQRTDAARDKRPGCDSEPAATASATAARGGRTGVRVELARYTVSAGERVLYGQRVFGVVRVTDVPATGRGRAYLIERELEQDGRSGLNALVVDYLLQARRLDAVPMVPESRPKSYPCLSHVAVPDLQGSSLPW